MRQAMSVKSSTLLVHRGRKSLNGFRYEVGHVTAPVSVVTVVKWTSSPSLDRVDSVLSIHRNSVPRLVQTASYKSDR